MPLFDSASFDEKFIAAVDRAEKLALCKQELANLDKALNARFKQNAPIEDLVSGRSAVIDEILFRIWKYFLNDNYQQLALIAVGGYGRAELHPQSDIDLLIMLPKKQTKELEQKVRQFLTFLWDTKLDIGHSVRSLKECIVEAKADITVTTNMMEARFLIGEQNLYTDLLKLTQPNKIWPSKKFFAQKWLEQQKRHNKYHDTAYNLEPNVKEGPGGLRDIQMIGWVAKRHFGANTLNELVDHNFLTQEELKSLLQGQATLWKIRFALHMITKRHEDRLLFDYQRELATEFGYKDTHVIAVEQFMQNYFKTVVELERLNEMLLQHFQETILKTKKNQKTKAPSKYFQNNRDFLEVNDDKVFEKYPSALLEIFLFLQTHPELKGVRASTIRLIRENTHRIDDDFRAQKENRLLFISILGQAHGVTHELRRMNRYGVLAAYLPEFANIVGRMQYDLFHHYTVDEHTLFVVRNMRRFTVPEFEHEFPFCSDLIKQLPNQVLVYIAGLYHDIAKGRGGDHSKLGALDASNFCQRHYLSEYDSKLVTWLVKSHLQLSITAQRKDINDINVINDFANFVGDKLHLDYLYVLTVADIRATNPNTWNSWKASLLEDLYRNVKDALQRGLNNPLAQKERMQETKEAAKNLLIENGLKIEEIESVWQHLRNSYFIRHHPDEICWHTEEIAQFNQKLSPIISIYSQEMRGSTPIFIYIEDKPYIFYKITSILENLQVSILDARVISSNNGYALNTFLVLDYNGKLIKEKTRLKHIRHQLFDLLSRKDEDEHSVTSHLPNRQLEQMKVKTRVILEQDKKGQRTVLKVITADRPGTLSRIALAFKLCKINLINARVSSFGETAEDTFVISNQAGKQLTTNEEKLTLEQTIKKTLSNFNQQT